MVFTRFSRLRWLMSLPLLAALTSCGLMAPASSNTVAEVRNVRRAAARIPADVLANAGLEEIWYVAPREDAERDERDAGVQSVHLLKEGLFLVTRPRVEGAQRLLKMLSRENGLSLWWEPVEGVISDAPFAYTYPTGSRKSPELFFRVEDTVHCLDLRYGAPLWRRKMEPPLASRVIANESHVFFGSSNGRFYAYRKGANVDDWMYRTGGPVDAAPQLGPSKVVFGSHDGTVYGLTPDQGWVSFRSWRAPTGARIVSDIVTYSRWVFAGSTDYKLYCLEETDGSVYWTFVAEAPIRDAPVVFRHRPNNEYVYCIATEGLRTQRRTLFAVPLPKGRVASGIAAWRREGVRRVITMGRETLYVLNELGPEGERSISALDVKTGREKFRLPIQGFHFVPMNHADAGRNARERGRIYLVSRHGAVQAIGEKS